MNKTTVDIAFINPGDRKTVFQGLGADVTAIEPPYLIASAAAYLRQKNFSVAIIDANAENISPAETAEKVKCMQPALVAIIVYGNQPSASTQNMSISGAIATAVQSATKSPVMMGGLHPSALPELTFEQEDIDFLIEGEVEVSLAQLLSALKNGQNFSTVGGLWYRQNTIVMRNAKAALERNLDVQMPIAAWDLLPMEKYRAHNWHCFDDIHNRSPYAAIYTSLGCPYSCTFCCINTPFGQPGLRVRSPELVVAEIEFLVTEYGVKNLKFIDEMFILKERHYMAIAELIIEKNLDLNIWAYARVDSVKEGTLKKLKQAGFNWLALGIESADSAVRDGAAKKMRVDDIKSVVEKIQDAGIRVIGNYIFGLPDDTLDSMQETLEMAIELNCEFSNMYCAMAYPGSQLHQTALEEGWQLPDVWHGYSQHSYVMQPLPSKVMAAKEIVQFRDNAFHQYFESDRYLSMLEEKFGLDVKLHMQEITQSRLKRKILEEEVAL